MTDKQKKPARRRFFQDFQQRIGGVVVHVVGGIDNGDTPAARARGHAEEAAEPAHFFHIKHGLELAAIVLAPLQHQQTRMRPRFHLTRNDIPRRNGEIGRTGIRRPIPQHVARDAIGERGLANARRAGNEPGLRRTP